MPKHKINGKKRPKRDPIMEAIKGRIDVAKIPATDVQEALGLEERATRMRMAQNGGEWKIKDLAKVAKCIEIPMSVILAEATEEYY